jgi:predicted small integral membrane protein
MKKNVGKTDRIIRSILGVSIVTLGFINQSWLGLIGAGIIVPAITGNDPLYALIKLNTKK